MAALLQLLPLLLCLCLLLVCLLQSRNELAEQHVRVVELEAALINQPPVPARRRRLLGSQRVANRLLRRQEAVSGGKRRLVKPRRIAWITLATGKTWAKQAVSYMESAQQHLCAGSKVSAHCYRPDPSVFHRLA